MNLGNNYMETIILFDVDGTLVSYGKYPENFVVIKSLISDLKKRGYKFGISTNRTLDNTVKKIYKDYGLNGDIFYESGAKVNKERLIQEKYKLNKKLKKIITLFLKENHIKTKVRIANNVTKSSNCIIINKKRKVTATVYFPSEFDLHLKTLIDYIKKDNYFDNMELNWETTQQKILISPRNINKINSAVKYYEGKNIILVTDFERFTEITKKSIKIYSIGSNFYFNQICDQVFPVFGEGIEKILKKLRSEG